MRTRLKVVVTLLAVAGGIWILQGLGVFPGSFMTGQIRWAWHGAATILAGVLHNLGRPAGANAPNPGLQGTCGRS